MALGSVIWQGYFLVLLEKDKCNEITKANS